MVKIAKRRAALFLYILTPFQLRNWRAHAKMGSIQDRNGMYLTEAEDTKNKARWFVNVHIIQESVFLKLWKMSLIDIVI